MCLLTCNTLPHWLLCKTLAGGFMEGRFGGASWDASSADTQVQTQQVLWLWPCSVRCPEVVPPWMRDGKGKALGRVMSGLPWTAAQNPFLCFLHPASCTHLSAVKTLVASLYLGPSVPPQAYILLSIRHGRCFSLCIKGNSICTCNKMSC